ncbi:pantothenate synthetase [Dictyobacter alpinus]|uniref:Pantothenate synthetase n=1 Tax=Dictyobacter alpinus TaxID=2014873 RepID=A0A402B8X4_9CHLR|nr:pantoate--beta-alanine ligase [Dictyobacter alpinus]GCE27808.1 pantothenate synthetase [Dictyobacter alpinus]
MRIVRTVQAMRHEHQQWTGSVGLVPTMGYLHEGHLSLVRKARSENEHVVVSIFVNPTQFGPQEDLATYPSNIEHDLALLRELDVESVFLPSAAEMYPTGFSTFVHPEGPLAEQGEGAIRPGHFRGVATVVQKLLHVVQPTHVYFGQKDAQQVAVVNRMILDLDIPVTLHVLPTVREPDGLAMSSRNSYLSTADRARANVVYRALQAARNAFEQQGEADITPLTRATITVLQQEQAVQLEYFELRDANTFQPLETLHKPALLLLAVRLGNIRLIDNFVLHADGTWDTGTILHQPSTAK